MRVRDVALLEVFVARYTMDAQCALDMHADAGEYSFIVALNDNDAYAGGGTLFERGNETVRPHVGETIVFDGQTRHAGLAITAGERYIMTGFMGYKHVDFCEGP